MNKEIMPEINIKYQKSFSESVEPDNREVEDEIETRSLYILLSKTKTLPSRFINFLNPMPYVHASIAFDENLEEMYSFARKKVHYPFYCGLIDENIEKGIFARKKGTECLVLRLPVTEEEYGRAHESVESFKANRKKYGYNYLGVLACKFHRSLDRKFAYFCTQFVDKVLQMSGINLFGKKPGQVTPEDYRTSDKLEHFYEGLLTNYRDWLDSFDLSPEEKSIRRMERQELRDQKKQQREVQREQFKEHREQQKELKLQQRDQQRELREQQRDLQRELRDQQREQQKELRDSQRQAQLELMEVQEREMREKQDAIGMKQQERRQEHSRTEVLSS